MCEDHEDQDVLQVSLLLTIQLNSTDVCVNVSSDRKSSALGVVLEM